MNSTFKKICGKAISTVALMVTKQNVNSACVFIMYQPKLPHNAGKLRK